MSSPSVHSIIPKYPTTFVLYCRNFTPLYVPPKFPRLSRLIKYGVPLTILKALGTSPHISYATAEILLERESENRIYGWDERHHHGGDERHRHGPPPQNDDAHDLLLGQKRRDPLLGLARDQFGYVRFSSHIRLLPFSHRRVALPQQSLSR